MCDALCVDYEFDDDNRRIYFEDVSGDRVWLLNNTFEIPECREKVMNALIEVAEYMNPKFDVCQPLFSLDVVRVDIHERNLRKQSRNR